MVGSLIDHRLFIIAANCTKIVEDEVKLYVTWLLTISLVSSKLWDFDS